MKPRFYSWIIFLLALLLRALYLVEIGGTPLVQMLLIDSTTYDRFAHLILEGRFHGEEVYSMNILYPWFLALIYKVALGKGMVLWVQALLDSVTCVMIGRLAARHFGDRTGFGSGLVAALYGPFIFYSGALLTPTLINFFCLATLLLLARYADSPRWPAAFTAGLTLGIASLGRGNSILLAPLALLFFLLIAQEKKRALRHWGAFAAGAALLLVLVTFRNYFVEKEFVPLSANYAAFYIGHNEKGNGLYTLPDFVASADFEGEVGGTQAAVSKALGREVTVAESASYLFEQGVAYIKANPAEDLLRTVKKFYFFWNRTEAGTNLSYYFARDFSLLLRILPITFGWLVPLAVVGAALRRREWKRDLILYLYMAVYLLTGLIFFVSSEYRLPIVPAIIPFAVHGALSIISRLAPGRSAGRHRKIGLPFPLVRTLLVLPLLILFCNYRTPLLKAQSLKRVDYLNFGILYKMEGNFAESKRMLRHSLEIDQAFGPAYEALSDVYRLEGDDQQASRYLHLARQYKLSGQYDRGDRRFSPDTEAMLEVARLYNEGDYPGALSGFTDLMTQYETAGDDLMVQRLLNNIGLCRYKMKDYPAAEKAFQTIIDENAMYVKAYYNLARVREAQGRIHEALDLYQRAVALEPEYVRAREAMSRLMGSDR